MENTLLHDLILLAALCGAVFSLFVALVLSRRFDVAQRRHRYEMDSLVHRMQRVEQQNILLSRNIGAMVQATQRVAAEVDRAAAQARRAAASTTAKAASSASEEEVRPAPLPRILH